MTNQVKAVPEGYHTVTPYMLIKNAAAALDFYKKAFGAVVNVSMSDPSGKVRHAEIRIGDSAIMLADEEHDAGAPHSAGVCSISILLYVENVDALFNQAVAAGAKVLRPVKDEFYGDRTGSVQDPFGFLWHIATHKETVSLEEMKKRAAALQG